MELKRIKKLAGIVTLSAAILVSPIASAAGNYKLNNSVRVYMNAANAKKKRNSVKTYNSGNYYIYKEANGMLNITKQEGVPGAWINPSDNKSTTDKKPTQDKKPGSSGKKTSVGVKKGNKFELKIKTYGYYTAANAKSHKDSRTVLKPGTFHIYKEYDGMLNITKSKGVPGAWINPGEKKEVKPAIPSTGGKKTHPTKGFTYSKVLNVRATAYTPDPAENGGWTVTATGKSLWSVQPGSKGYIAVDPRIIPLGTKVYVDGYGYASAEDTGGAIKGYKIDVLLRSKAAAYEWGVRNVKLYILD